MAVVILWCIVCSKDKVEKYLNGQVCDGKMTLAEAQKGIVTDWYQVYQSMPKK